MAVYKADILDVELNTGNIARSFLCHNIGKDDTKADRFGVRVFRDGVAESLSGCSIQGYMMRPNGTNLAITGSNTGVSGNEAWVDLPQAAYDYEGQFCLALKLIGGGVTGTIRIIDGMINNTFVDDALVPMQSVPTYQEILAVYDQMVAAKNGSVRFDQSQSLTETQKSIARMNIDAARDSDVSDLKSAINYIGMWSDHRNVTENVALSNTIVTDVDIKNGQKYTVEVVDKSSLLTGLTVYADGSAIQINASSNTVYEKTASADIETISIYASKTQVVGTGTVTIIVKTVDETIKNEIEEIQEAISDPNENLISSYDIKKKLDGVTETNIIADFDQKKFTATLTYVYEIIYKIENPVVGSKVGIFIESISGGINTQDVQISQFNSSDTRIDYQPNKTAWKTNGGYVTAEVVSGCSYVNFILYPTSSGGLSDQNPAIYSGIYITNTAQEPYLNAKENPKTTEFSQKVQNNYFYSQDVYIPQNEQYYTKVLITTTGEESASSANWTTKPNVIGSDFLTAKANTGYGLSLTGWYNENFLGYFENGAYSPTLTSYYQEISIADAFAAGATSVRLTLNKTSIGGVSATKNISYTKRSAYDIPNLRVIASTAYSNKVKSIAHRGLSALYPENTMPAFVMAKHFGFHYGETDLQKTSDGHYVCVHDSTLTRVTNGALTGAVSSYTLAELQAVSFGSYLGPRWANTTVLTFEDYIDLCVALQLSPAIELKESNSFNSDIPTLVAYVLNAGIDDAIWITGSTYAGAVRAADPKAIVAVVADSFTEQQVVNFSQFVINGDKNTAIIDCNYTGVDATLVENCRDNNISLGAWTVDDKEDIVSLVKSGVTAITSNRYPASIAALEHYIDLI